MKLMFSLLILTLSISSYAQTNSIGDFFSAIQGTWTGTGNVQIGLGSHPGSYSIKVTQDAVQSADGEWSVRTQITGTPTPSDSTVSYVISGADLMMTTTQYSEAAVLKVATPQELSFVVDHVDTVTHAEVRLDRDYAIDASGSLNVIADIVQNGRLVQRFTYKLTKSN